MKNNITVNKLSKHRLQHFPVSIFSIVMGLTGFAIAIQKVVELGYVQDFYGITTLILSSVIFVVLLIIFILRIINYPSTITNEFAHPIRRNFIPAISISFILQSILYLHYSPSFALWLWGIGTIIQLGLSLIIISSWLWRDGIKPEHLNPAWFIPAVGNMLVPVAGVTLGFSDISWFFFSVGLLFWIILLISFFYRSFFHDQLSPKMYPTLFILIAPPAVFVISISKLLVEPITAMKMSYSISVFILLLLITRLRVFIKLPFFISWWAYSFPIASLSIASIVMYKYTNQSLYLIFSLLLLACLTVIVILLVIKTILAIINKNVCIEE